MKVIVYHDYYGCDTGCCGHSVELVEDHIDLDDLQFSYNSNRNFEFDHPYLWKLDADSKAEAVREFIINKVREKFGEEHIKDINFDECLVLDD